MYLTEKEIFNQYTALEKTYKYLTGRKEELTAFKNNQNFKNITFIGSGSSYCLCQSAEISAKIHLGIPANSLAAGDLMLNFPHYKNLIKDTLLVAPTRSGNTSEVVQAVMKAQNEFNVPCISICTQKESDLSRLVDFSLEMPWAFDESVCQTRTVTNLYMANLMLIAILADKENIIEDIRSVLSQGDSYLSQYTELLKDFSQKNSWEKVIILADSELQGIAAEGAIAFKEISRDPSNYHHLLDFRHGPMVLLDNDTLVIMATSPHGLSYQADLVGELKERGARVVTVGSLNEKITQSDLHIAIPNTKVYGVRGIPYILVPQVIAYHRALVKGVNPDLPQGLEPWIKL